MPDENGRPISYEDRALDAFPILVNSHYYFGNSASSFRPLIGGNAGVYFITTRYNSTNGRFHGSEWHLGLAPDIGFMAEFMNDIQMMLTLRYNHAFKTSTMPARSYFSLNIGFVSVSLF
jgi:outer membrane protein W